MRTGNRQPLGISALSGQAAHSIYPMSPLVKVVGTLESRIRRTHLYLSPQIGVRGSKTSQLQHISNVPTGKSGGNPGIKDSSNSPLSVTADRCER